MDHHTAHELLVKFPITWKALRDHALDQFFDDKVEGMSTVNRSVPIGQAWKIYDAALAQQDQAAVIDMQNTRDALLACNVVRDFGMPAAEPEAA